MSNRHKLSLPPAGGGHNACVLFLRRGPDDQWSIGGIYSSMDLARAARERVNYPGQHLLSPLIAMDQDHFPSIASAIFTEVTPG